MMKIVYVIVITTNNANDKANAIRFWNYIVAMIFTTILR
jgi:hypothetical protein